MKIVTRIVLLAIVLVLIGAGWYLFYKQLGTGGAPEETDDILCAQVITPARNPETQQVMDFPTPCDVPSGWDVLTPGSDGGEARVVQVETQIGKEVSALDVSILPREVLSDSRCAVEVTCIWAGTVKLRATLSSGLGTANQIFELGVPITTEAEEITLVKVDPAPHQNITIAPGAYVFGFEIRKR